MAPTIYTPDPDATYTLTHVPGFVDDVVHQAQWRAEKAAEYPDDPRNANAAEALGALAGWLKARPSSRLTRLDDALARLYADDDTASSFVPGITDRLGRFGFTLVPLHARGLAFETFLTTLTDDIEEHLGPPPSTIEQRVQKLAETYVESLKDLRDAHLDDARQAFDDAAVEEARQSLEPVPDEDRLNEDRQEVLTQARQDFFTMVQDAEQDAWGT
jgi:hypothetical protein